jgi:hypothetical protein
MCIHKTTAGICAKLSNGEVAEYCVEGPCPDDTPTNADRIRSMSDEELHCFLLGFQVSTISDYKRGIMPNAEKCLDFLQQPAEEG